MSSHQSSSADLNGSLSFAHSATPHTQNACYLGIDLGSTTAKYVLLSPTGQVLARNYQRHQSAVVDTLRQELSELKQFLKYPVKIVLTGSAALNLAETLKTDFVQEVVAATAFLKAQDETVDVAIELGGEDSKIIFLSHGVELRMNEACAGGTGAFIDQMATLLNMSPTELNEQSLQAENTYPIAARCGVFAKTDLVALLNQGVGKADIAKSVFDAVCEQTISGLACGRQIVGNIAFLGGPLSFLTGLKQSFITKLSSLNPDTSFLSLNDTQYAIAHGAALTLLQKERQNKLLQQNPKHQSSRYQKTQDNTVAITSPCLEAHHPARTRSNSSSESTAIREPGGSGSTPGSTVLPAVVPAPATAVAASGDFSSAQTAGTHTIASFINALSCAPKTSGTRRLNPLFASSPAVIPASSAATTTTAETNTTTAAAPVISSPDNTSVSAEPPTPAAHTTDVTGPVFYADEVAAAKNMAGESYEDFVARHRRHTVAVKDLSCANGPLYLGIDLGSTTVKMALINEKQELLASSYDHNGGEPLQSLLPKLRQFLNALPESAYIAAICTTGYGADLAKAALNAQFSEVETLAHQKAAVAFDPEVSYVIDIGGQDMKCIKVHQGIIASIQLNEACSSGCGSFLETFAAQLKLPLAQFVKLALTAGHPCDLGTRCTVFMNSKVKQAQRDNVPVGDIAAGLCLSIVRNALYKVLRIHDSSELGEHVVVQGGTFLNDAILRAFELSLGRNVIRPDIAGLMGAYGSALIARERLQPEFKNKEHALSFTDEIFDLSKIRTKTFRCRGCSNHCELTMNTFMSGRRHISGNRCDFAVRQGGTASKNNSHNFYDFKLDLLFNRPVLLSRAQHAEAAAEAEMKAAAAAQKAAARTALAPRRTAGAAGAAGTAHSAPTAAALNTDEQAALPAADKTSAPAASRTVPRSYKTGSSARTGQENSSIPVIPASEGVATRGTIGIPRVLNMFEHYPFWHALFTRLGFNIALSPLSNRKTASSGTQSIPSQSLCFPAKLTHGHICALADQGINRIFLPCIPREIKVFVESDDSFSCPVVGGYPEALRLNLNSMYPELKLHTPYLALDSDKSIMAALKELDDTLTRHEMKEAVSCARAAQSAYQHQLIVQAQAEIDRARSEHLQLVVLSGHPYHLDPQINHGIPALLASMGTVIVSEDAVAHMVKEPPQLDVVNQWALHSRLYRAAQFVLEHEEAELVQLVSFGCGIDAITSEQVKKLLERHHRLYTMLKIDEGDTLGAARIRLRSLLCAAGAGAGTAAGSAAGNAIPVHVSTEPVTAPAHATTVTSSTPTTGIPDGSRATGASGAAGHTISLSEALGSRTLEGRTLYMPQMAPLHFPLVVTALRASGYKVELLDTVSSSAIELGLKLVNNDACYPAIVTIGQLLEPVATGTIDPEHSALLLAQTCGPCRATNYPALLQWALHSLNADNIPIVTFQNSNLHDDKLHLKLGLKGIKRLMMAVFYGDLLQNLYLHCHTYEQVPGTAGKLVAQYHQALDAAALGNTRKFRQQVRRIISDFAQIPLRQELRPKVGIVGEILLKYHPQANSNLTEQIIAEGGEPVIGDIAAFLLYCLHDSVYQAQYLGAARLPAALSWLTLKHFENYRRIISSELKRQNMMPLPAFNELMDCAQEFVSLGQQAGEGWLLTAEMVDFVKNNVDNILCVQPFACLPNHITGKGVMRALREQFPQINTCSIDFEAGSAQSNVVNRLKLFISQARDNLIVRCATRATAAATAAATDGAVAAPTAAAAGAAAVSAQTSTTAGVETARISLFAPHHAQHSDHADNDEQDYHNDSSDDHDHVIGS